MDKIQLQRLRELPIEGVAERAGLEVAHHKALCPFHDDHHASLSFNTRRNTFRCFVCEAHGGTIDLAMGCLNKGFREACEWLAGHEPASHSVTGSRVGGREFEASRYARFFERPWLSEAARRFLFEERGIDARVARWCRLTSWRDRQGVEWLEIPYFDREWRLRGIQKRNLTKGARPRFRFPQGSECGIYNLPVLNRLRAGEPLYITEGCSDCWAALSAGHKAVAIPSATLLKRKDMELLEGLNVELGTEFHMFPDRDEPGERLFMQLQGVLPNLVHHQLPAGCKDFGEYYIKSKGYGK